LIDALSFWVNGFKNVTASYGVEGFTADHLSGLIEHRVKKVFIAYDRDEAGDQAAEKLSKRLLAEGIETLRVQFPRGMDANEFICKVKPAEQSLKLCLQTAAWMGRVKKVELTPEIKPEATSPSLAAACLPSVAAFKEDAAKKEKEVSVTNEVPPLAEAKPMVTQSQSIVTDTQPLMADEQPVELRGEDVIIRVGSREYRIRGLKKNLSFEVLRVNLRVAVSEKFFIDTLDLYQAKARTHYVAASSKEVELPEETIKRDLGRVLFRLEELQEKEIQNTSAGKTLKKEVQLTTSEKEEALALLKSPNLIATILADFNRAGVIGEEVNKLVGYLAAVSRKLDDPLAVVIQSSSAAGKSSLMEAVLAMVPEEDKVKYSAMTGQSLFYMGEKDLKHKILAIAEEQGASQASYALKLLQSEGEISIASTGKDSVTGRLITHQYRVEGPVMIFLTTTAIEIDEELLNRCLVLTVNETREQTKAIHGLQRKGQTLGGLLLRQERAHLLKLHQNAQRLLRPLWVVNPFAEKLTFLDHQTRTRRDHMKYLALIRTIALLHQYQRESQWTTHRGKAMEYIEVEKRDIEIANELCHQVLGRSLDELPPQTRKLLTLLSELVQDVCSREKITRGEYRFTRRDVRERIGWSDFQVQVHISKLVSLEYVLVHRGGRGQSFVYELLFDPELVKSGQLQLMGLIDPAHFGDDARVLGESAGELSAHAGELTQSFEHPKGVIEGSSRPQVAPVEGTFQSLKMIHQSYSSSLLSSLIASPGHRGASPSSIVNSVVIDEEVSFTQGGVP
jgi:DNA primase